MKPQTVDVAKKVLSEMVPFALGNAPSKAQRKLLDLVSNVVFPKLDEPWRHYHNFENHIEPMLYDLRSGWLTHLQPDLTKEVKELYFWAALYHDAVYEIDVPFKGYNEDASHQLWVKHARESGIEESIVNKVSQIILATAVHETTDPIIERFLHLDLWGYMRPFYSVLRDEMLIRKEYEKYDWEVYKEGRKKFLKEYMEKPVVKSMAGYVHTNMQKQLEYMEFVQPKIAIYPGSFNPLHTGHMEVFNKANKIFDKVIWVFATNLDKEAAEKQIPEALKYNQVIVHSGSIVELIRSLQYPVTIIRGIRNGKDFDAEQDYLEWLDEINGSPLQSVNIFSDVAHKKISSTAIRTVSKIHPETTEKFIIK